MPLAKFTRDEIKAHNALITTKCPRWFNFWSRRPHHDWMHVDIQLQYDTYEVEEGFKTHWVPHYRPAKLIICKNCNWIEVYNSDTRGY